MLSKLDEKLLLNEPKLQKVEIQPYQDNPIYLISQNYDFQTE